MVTEADWHDWSREDLSPYIETVLEAFTPKRIMFGSDWPFMNLASSYRRWIDTVRAAIAQLSATEQERILAETAIEAYGLTMT
jgi:L-fuconolactonase